MSQIPSMPHKTSLSALFPLIDLSELANFEADSPESVSVFTNTDSSSDELKISCP